jgi:hypothetical protein
MGKILETLKKWGILKAGGVAGTYTNAKDRPFTNGDDDYIPNGFSVVKNGETQKPKDNEQTAANGEQNTTSK